MNKKKGPWTIIATKTVYKTPWISLIEDEVIKPNGQKGTFSTIDIKPGVSILPLDEKGNVYLTLEFHYGVARELIEAVSGGIDKNETPLEAAKRELQEELGFKAKKWTYLGYVDPFTTYCNSPNHMYLARDLTKSKPSPDSTERIKMVKVPFSKAHDLVTKSIITHAGSAVLILKAKEFLNL